MAHKTQADSGNHFWPDFIEHLKHRDDFFHAPNMVGNTRFHRRSNPQRLMNPGKIVVHKVRRHGVFEVFQLLWKRIRQARKPAHLHTHREVVPLCNAGVDVFVIRLATNHSLGRRLRRESRRAKYDEMRPRERTGGYVTEAE